MQRKKDVIKAQNAEIRRLSNIIASQSTGLISDDFASDANTTSYVRLLEQLDLQQYIAANYIDNLPFDNHEFLTHVYRFGTTVIVKDPLLAYGEPVPLTWDRNNKITSLQVIYHRPNGDKIKHAKVFKLGEYALYWDLVPNVVGNPVTGRYHVMTKVVIRQMAEIFARLNINITLSGGKLFLLAQDNNTQAVIQEELKKSFSSDSPFVVLNTQGFGTQVTFEQPAAMFNELFQALKQYESYRLATHGLGRNEIGNEKRDRLVVNETDNLSDGTKYTYEFKYIMFEQFKHELDARFGYKINRRCYD